jgi:4-carboxymuconolactone decarboxylase
MTRSKPRIGNLPREEWTNEAREVFAFWGEPDAWENGSRTNTMMTMAQHPRLGMAFNIFGKQVLLDSTLPLRPRELVVLRVSWHLKSEYEWHYHVGYALAAGITMAEVAAIRDGPDSPIWHGKETDRAVLRAADELIRDATITDETWATLAASFDPKQLMDLVFTAGNYVLFSWAIAAFGIPLEEGADQIGFDLKTASGVNPGGSQRPGESEDWAANSGIHSEGSNGREP